jgi:hypothetical protein
VIEHIERIVNEEGIYEGDIHEKVEIPEDQKT